MKDPKSASSDPQEITTTDEPVEPRIKEARRHHGDPLEEVAGDEKSQRSPDRGDG